MAPVWDTVTTVTIWCLQSVGTRNSGKEVRIATMWFTWTPCGLLFLPVDFDIWYHDRNILSWRCGGIPMDELESPLSPFPLGTCKASQSVLDVITDLETNLHQKQPMAKSSPLIPVPISWCPWPCGSYIILSPGFDTGEVDVFHDSGESWLPCIPLCWLRLPDSSLVSTGYQELHSVQVENENTTVAQSHSGPWAERPGWSPLWVVISVTCAVNFRKALGLSITSQPGLACSFGPQHFQLVKFLEGDDRWKLPWFTESWFGCNLGRAETALQSHRPGKAPLSCLHRKLITGCLS